MATTMKCTLSSDSKYSPKNVLKNIYKYFVNIMISIQNSKKGTKIMLSKMETYSQINIAAYIIYNFNNYVNDTNNFKMHGFINRFKNIDIVNQSWEKKIEKFAHICNDFVNHTIQFTGMNMLLMIKEYPQNKQSIQINAQDIYDIFNDNNTIVYCQQITKYTFGIMFLNNKDSKQYSETIHKQVLEVEDQNKYIILSQYIQPCIQQKTKMYDWKTNTHIDCVKIPYMKHQIIPISTIMETSTYRKEIPMKK